MTFTPNEVRYLAGQRLGRLATIGPDGAPQVRPVAFFVHGAAGTSDVGGLHMGTTQKFRNVERDGRAALVVDDLAPGDGWNPRALEVRGRAEALRDHEPPREGFSREIIRIHADRVISWGVGD